MKNALPSQNPVCRYCPGCQHRVKGANFGGLKGTTLYRLIGVGGGQKLYSSFYVFGWRSGRRTAYRKGSPGFSSTIGLKAMPCRPSTRCSKLPVRNDLSKPS